MNDPVNHPAHYNNHPSGVECIQVTEHMNFCLGNAFKYLWRADQKGNAVEDLKKAVWYIEREIARREQPDKTIRDSVICGKPHPHRENVICTKENGHTDRHGRRELAFSVLWGTRPKEVAAS